MFGIGIQELLVVLLILLLLFGGKRLPELAKSLGLAMKELRNGFKDGEETSSESKKENSSKK